MKAGKISSLLLVLLITALATVVRVFLMDARSDLDASVVSQAVGFASVVAGASFIVLAPVGIAIDRAIANLRRGIEGASLPVRAR